MSVVVVSPSRVETWRETILTTRQVVTEASAAVLDALEAFALSRPDRGPRSSGATTVLDAQSATMAHAADDLGGFLDAVVAADRTGLASPVRGPIGAVDLVSFQEDDVRWLTRGARTCVFDAHLARLRSRLAELRADEPSTGLVDRARRRRWQRDVAALERELGQFESLAAPVHLGWAGVGSERWPSYAAFTADVEAATAQAEALRPVAEPATHPRTRAGRDAAADARFEAEHPFVRAALRNDVVITPGRLELLLELDALVTSPLEEFLAQRATATTGHPDLDWTADGCSGPIPDQAEDTCLRHDFIYRNGRMLRDQWGAPGSVSTDLKSYADDRFGDELFDAYDNDFWEKILVSEWLFGAEIAVSWFGAVNSPWAPPASDAFYGDAPPPGS